MKCHNILKIFTKLVQNFPQNNPVIPDENFKVGRTKIHEFKRACWCISEFRNSSPRLRPRQKTDKNLTVIYKKPF